MRIFHELAVPFKRLWCVLARHRWVCWGELSGFTQLTDLEAGKGRVRGIAACERCGLVRAYRVQVPK